MERRGISTDTPSTANGNDIGIGSDGQKVLQDTMSLYEPDRFVMPALLGTCTPPDQQGQNFTFNINSMETDTALDEWMLMNWSGTGG
ncbi:MAG: hypothetical protein Q9164_007945 [Protoblastenia rupestris]